MSITLDMANITVHLGGRCVLRDVSLAVPANEFIAVLGDNGAGKTTLMRAILGLAPLTHGKICFAGRPITWRNRRAWRRRIGYVPQILNYDETMPISARDVIAIGRTARAGLLRRLRPADWRLVEEAAAFAGITDLLDRPIGRLSGGERQKVQLARVICQQPELLLLDEFSSNLSAAARADCLHLLERLRLQYNYTIILITHHISTIPAGCRRAVALDAGVKKFDGDIQECHDRYLA